MRRIVIVGNAGTGKSTFADRLGQLLKIPVVHLDGLNWQPEWKPLPAEDFRACLQQAISGDVWITDGNYAALTFDLRLPRADLFIWLEQPILICSWRVFRRALRSYVRATEHLAAGCPERFDRRFLHRLRFIANFNRVNRPLIATNRLARGPNLPVIVLRGDRKISDFLSSAGKPVL